MPRKLLSKRATEPTTVEEEKKEEVPPPPPPPPAVVPEAPSKKGRKNKKEADKVEPAIEKKRKKKAKKPRAPSAYSLFVKECRSNGTVTMGEGGLSEFSKACSALWKDHPDKAKFEAMAAEKKKEMQEAAPPKRAPSAYIRFSVQDRTKRKLENPNLTFKELSQQCAAAWKELSPEEKEGWKTVPVA